MRVAILASAIGAALLLATCCCPDVSDPCATPPAATPDAWIEIEEAIPLSDVPDSVIAAARAAKPGIVFEEAVREQERGRVVYELEGEVDGEDWEVEVTADGRVLEVEREDDGKSGKSASSGKSGKSASSGKSGKSASSGKSGKSASSGKSGKSD